jgi:pSer/pThr/pTyr-binding forkhead associated (FHA) protein
MVSKESWKEHQPWRSQPTGSSDNSVSSLASDPDPDPEPAAVAAEPEEPILRLKVSSGGRATERALHGEALIGRRDRQQSNFPQIAFNQDEAVSRQHATILRRDGCFYLKDLGSTNGTVHNRVLLARGEEVLLSTNDVIDLGTYSRIFIRSAPVLSTESPAVRPVPVPRAMPAVPVKPAAPPQEREPEPAPWEAPAPVFASAGRPRFNLDAPVEEEALEREHALVAASSGSASSGGWMPGTRHLVPLGAEQDEDE